MGRAGCTLHVQSARRRGPASSGGGDGRASASPSRQTGAAQTRGRCGWRLWACRQPAGRGRGGVRMGRRCTGPRHGAAVTRRRRHPAHGACQAERLVLVFQCQWGPAASGGPRSGRKRVRALRVVQPHPRSAAGAGPLCRSSTAFVGPVRIRTGRRGTWRQPSRTQAPSPPRPCSVLTLHCRRCAVLLFCILATALTGLSALIACISRCFVAERGEGGTGGRVGDAVEPRRRTGRRECACMRPLSVPAEEATQHPELAWSLNRIPCLHSFSALPWLQLHSHSGAGRTGWRLQEAPAVAQRGRGVTTRRHEEGTSAVESSSHRQIDQRGR